MERVARAVEDGASRATASPGPGRGGHDTSVGVRREGGRAQELALRLATGWAWLGSRPWAFLALGSDGIGWQTSPAAGRSSIGPRSNGPALAISIPEVPGASDSYGLFRRLGDHLVTGPTGTTSATSISC